MRTREGIEKLNFFIDMQKFRHMQFGISSWIARSDFLHLQGNLWLSGFPVVPSPKTSPKEIHASWHVSEIKDRKL